MFPNTFTSIVTKFVSITVLAFVVVTLALVALDKPVRADDCANTQCGPVIDGVPTCEEGATNICSPIGHRCRNFSCYAL